ncbi:hypothetical protein [uncultured Thiodictyon sp.]|jgi:hypothetical protein|uniref:hypothetical protein n=1 Tax=uncultured Thiodictyon sp. TaxID=1846217 RepID=UPI0025D670A2|nr:hypothetical protein [uncultured Thiodictyon sp.]
MDNFTAPATGRTGEPVCVDTHPQTNESRDGGGAAIEGASAGNRQGDCTPPEARDHGRA